MKQFIYITGSTETNIFKIGLSSNPEQRVKNINGSSNQKNDYQKIYEVHNMNLSEKSLHLKFKEQRLNGEWFKLTQEDLEWIEENAAIYVDKSLAATKSNFKRLTVNIDKISELTNLSGAELSILLAMIKFTQLNECVLTTSRRRVIANLANVKDSTFNVSLGRMIDKGVLAKSEGSLFINPDLIRF